MTIKNVAIIGASSQIAQDYIERLLKKSTREIFLFSRNPKFLMGENHIQDKKRCKSLGYEDFGLSEYDLIINFVGASNPIKIIAMGYDIFNLTNYYDNLAIEYLKKHTNTAYIFVSSGAAYGNVFSMEPVGEFTNSTFNLNNLLPNEYYGAAKYLVEQRHRALDCLNITDLRVFSYFSERQNLKSSLLMADVIRSIKSGEFLKTNEENIFRDYIDPDDFYNLIECILLAGNINVSLDCYSLSPIGKIEMLKRLHLEFGLKYKFIKDNFNSHSVGSKSFYYSLNKKAARLGYFPSKSSIETILNQVALLLACKNRGMSKQLNEDLS